MGPLTTAFTCYAAGGFIFWLIVRDEFPKEVARFPRMTALMVSLWPALLSAGVLMAVWDSAHKLAVWVRR